MAIYLGKVSDHKNFQYNFLSRRNLDTLKARRIAHYKAMIKAIEDDTKDFDRYLRYERKLRKMILSKRYSYKRLEHLMDKVRQMRWYIEEEFGRSDDQCISALPSPEGYAQKLWEDAKRSALAEQRRAHYETQRHEMYAMINRGEASYENFCPDCCHKWEERDVDEWVDYDEEVVHQTWYCPECTKTLWRDKEMWY